VLVAAVLVAVLTWTSRPGFARQSSRGNAPAADDDVHVLHVQQNVYMIAGPGVNSAVQVGDEGLVVVDTMTAGVSDKLVAALRSLSSKPVVQIINTHIHPDHTGGNATVADMNVGARFGVRAPILAHENVVQLMSAESGKFKTVPALWPTETYFEDGRDLFRNGEGIQVFYQPRAHTGGDSLVYFRRSDVVVAGDVFTPQRYPVFDLDQGGSVNGILAGLNHLLRITVPATNEEGGTYVIPGHGHLCDEADVSDYRDMVTIVRDRIEDAIKRKMTLEQVKAARLTRDYDGIYATPEYSGDMFVEAVYKSLSTSSGASEKAATAPRTTPGKKR
jgi:glyoxylase-like metal-dependent hydrolase (beta-lactamase superfamily II)